MRLHSHHLGFDHIARVRFAGTLGRSIAVATIALCGVACSAAEEPTADSIAAALQLADGGFDETVEMPEFGGEAAAAPDRAITDPTADRPTVQDLSTRPEVAKVHVHVEWGQFPRSRQEEAYDWSGSFTVNRGAILVRRVTRFELFDRVRPRTDATTVEVRSRTRPHHDGMTMTLLDPEPNAAAPLTLTYVRAADTAGEPTVIQVDTLVDEPRVVREDGAHRMVAGARVDMADRCQQGFMRGVWRQVGEAGHGRFFGEVVNATGARVGHVRGIYGPHPERGERVLFGKYIDLRGEARGLLRGTYAEGELRGQWRLRNEEVGGLAGQYDRAAGERADGRFVARFAELTCDRPDTPSTRPPGPAPVGPPEGRGMGGGTGGSRGNAGGMGNGRGNAGGMGGGSTSDVPPTASAS